MGASASFKHHAKLKNYISWFEIPVYDMRRAALFYNTIYNMEMEVVPNGDFTMAYFPVDSGIGGALIQGPGCFPSDVGVLIYLNAGDDMDSILGRIELAGGRIIMSKTLIGGDGGYFALFVDSEGNRLALHQRPSNDGKRPPASSTPKAVKKAPAKKTARVALKKAKR